MFWNVFSRPKYGGRPCPGEDTVASLCNMQECSGSQTDFLAEQCASTDDEPVHGRKYHWLPNTDAFGKFRIHASNIKQVILLPNQLIVRCSFAVA